MYNNLLECNFGGMIVAKRILSILLVCVLAASLLPVQVFAAGADANTPQTHPNTYTNTGNQRADIIGVALTQVGYLEYPENNTKYGAALNVNHLGWCGAFVSWCAIQAGIPNSVLVKTGVPSPASYGLTAKPSDYIPQRGDLFFTPNNSHVGLVYNVNGAYFESIEGNTYSAGPQGVYRRTHKISDYVFASPDYQGSGNHNYKEYSDVAHPHKIYYKCTDAGCTSQYYPGATTTRTDCAECKQLTCTHSFGAWSNADDDNHVHTCTICSKAETAKHTWDAGEITQAPGCSITGIKTFTCTSCDAIKTQTLPQDDTHSLTDWTKVDDTYHDRSCLKCKSKETKQHAWDAGTITLAPTCLAEGVRTYKCTDCGAEKTATISKSTAHTYSAWKQVDETNHSRSCTACGVEEVKKHSMSRSWYSNLTSHWYECADCQLQTKLDKHTFGEACDSPCTVCKYKSESGHHLTDQWSSDAESHWYACSSCDIKDSAAAHVFDTPCDDTCDTCGHVRQTTHNYGNSYVSDGSNHWFECVDCGKQDQLAGHQSSEPEYEGAATHCIVCNLQMSEEKSHEHFYHESTGDEFTHWGVCVCGEVMETVPHTWSIKTGLCSACGTLMPVQEVVDEDLTMWIFGGVGLVVLIIVLVVIIVVIIKKSKLEEKKSGE